MRRSRVERSGAMTANKQRSLTDFSRTGGTAPDSGAYVGQQAAYDLRIRIPAHWLDTSHWLRCAALEVLDRLLRWKR
jgi:hypothetical protein